VEQFFTIRTEDSFLLIMSLFSFLRRCWVKMRCQICQSLFDFMKYPFVGSIYFYLAAYTNNMRGRIHTLQNEIKTIEGMLDSLSGPMLEVALEELKNMQFEMDMLNRSEERNANSALVSNAEMHEPALHSW
jgi:hypothetical protein